MPVLRGSKKSLPCCLLHGLLHSVDPVPTTQLCHSKSPIFLVSYHITLWLSIHKTCSGSDLEQWRHNRVNQSILRILSFQHFQLCLWPKERVLQFLPCLCRISLDSLQPLPRSFPFPQKRYYDSTFTLLKDTHWHTVLLLACSIWPSVLTETQTGCYPLVLLLSLLQQCQGEQTLCNCLSTANFILSLAMETRSAKVAEPGLHYNTVVCQLNFTVQLTIPEPWNLIYLKK